MKKTQSKFIIDMDGTLYHLGGKAGGTFSGSEFSLKIRANCYEFLSKKRGISLDAAEKEYLRLKEAWKGELSLGIEAEFGIDRYEYLNTTWDIDPTSFITTDTDVRAALKTLQGRMALLTAAPKIWADRVLAHLQVAELFPIVYSGEPNLRKPNPEVFRAVATLLETQPENTISVGDQEESDILPAQSVGMKTIRVGLERGQADYQIKSIAELVPLLRKENLL